MGLEPEDPGHLWAPSTFALCPWTSSFPFLSFRCNFLPHLGNKNTLAKYIQEPMEIFWGPIPDMLSFRVDLICGN